MRIRDCRRLVAGILVGASLVLGLPGWAHGATQVETFTTNGTVSVSLPGAPNGAGVTFSSNTTLQALDFTPGSVVFHGTPVDFDGKEPQFLAALMDAGIATPVPAGPAIVVVTGTGTVTGGPWAGGGGGGGCNVVGGDVPLGPMFSNSRLDITAGPGVDLVTRVPVWTPTIIPGLTGHTVTVEGPLNITAVDAVNGIVSFTLNGGIFVQNDAIPTLGTIGAICLAIGLLGFAIRALSARTRGGTASSV